MRSFIFLCSILFLVQGTGCTQNKNKSSVNSSYDPTKKVGVSCEGCEAIFESPIPFEKLNSTDTLPDFNEPGPKIEISGIVYQRDGRTPARDVIIYVYHTDQTGHYSKKGDDPDSYREGWGQRHGYIRGWMKTDKNGFYQFYTLRPVPYPKANIPAHIHVTVKEPDKNEYWIDEYLFDDDPLLTETERKKAENRGGDGILKMVPQPNGISHGTRHILLGVNVPNYPFAGLPKLKSGLALGSNCPAFDPLHLSGADSGKKACPMCKYGYGQGIMVWFNHANLEQMSEFAKKLETEMERRGEKKLRVFLVYMNPFYNQSTKEGEGILGRKIRKWCDEQGLKKLAMLWIPSPVDEKTAGLYQINPDAKNTVFVYKQRKILAKWVNIEYDDASLNAILKTL